MAFQDRSSVSGSTSHRPGASVYLVIGAVSVLAAILLATDARGSLVIAPGVGAVLGVPGHFDVLALGRMTRAGYSVIASIGLIILFNVIKFLLIEVPIISYMLDPDRTAARVDRLSAWLREHQIKAIAAVVGIIGVVLIERGIARLG